MIQRKRSLSTMLAGALALSALAGCAGNGGGAAGEAAQGAREGQPAAQQPAAPAQPQAPAGPGPVEAKPAKITWWTGWDAAAGPGDMIKKFNEKYPQIEVEHIQFRNNNEGNVKVDTSLLAGQEIDVFFNFGAERMDPRAKKNLLLDLSEFIERDKFDVAAELGTGIYQLNGKYYGLPATSNTYGIWLNKKMLDEAGLPTPTAWTLDEFADYARKLTKGDGPSKVYGSSFSQAPDVWAQPAIGAFPKDPWYQADGSSNWTDPAFKKALEFKVNAENVEKFQFPYKEYKATKVTLNDTFITGRVAMGAYSNALARIVADSGKYPRDFKVELAPFPTLEKGQQNYMGGVNYFGYLAINAKSKEKEASWVFMKWLLTEGAEGFAKVGHLPTWKKTDKESLVKAMFGDKAEELVNVEQFKKVMLNYDAPAQAETNFTARAQLKSIMESEMENVIYDKSSVDDALAKMKKDSDEAIQKAK